MDVSLDERERLLTRLERFQKMHARLHAEEQRALARLAALPLPASLDTHDKQYVVDEIAAVLRLAPRTAGARLSTAQDLVGRYRATLAAMARGELTLEHARALSDEALGVDDVTAAKVEARVLDRAGGKTPAQVRACARRAVASLDPRPAEVKPDPREERRVCPRRADALADLGRGEVRPTGGIGLEVIVSLSTLLGFDEQAGEIKGVGPVPAAVARRLADDSTGTWRRWLTDPAGQVIDTSPNYEPPARMARFVKDRDSTCRFPGCRAARNDIDHITPWPTGATEPANLHLLCPRHPHLTHEAGWSVHRTPDGITHWRSPTGRSFDKPPTNSPSTPPCPHGTNPPRSEPQQHRASGVRSQCPARGSTGKRPSPRCSRSRHHRYESSSRAVCGCPRHCAPAATFRS